MGLGVVVGLGLVVKNLEVVEVEPCVVVSIDVVLVAVVVFITRVISIFILKRKVKEMSRCDTRG